MPILAKFKFIKYLLKKKQINSNPVFTFPALIWPRRRELRGGRSCFSVLLPPQSGSPGWLFPCVTGVLVKMRIGYTAVAN